MEWRVWSDGEFGRGDYALAPRIPTGDASREWEFLSLSYETLGLNSQPALKTPTHSLHPARPHAGPRSRHDFSPMAKNCR